ncbi:MAG: segregation/condensation protein A [Gammaproteobacteria bacterium]|nr:segregation/condensation protein A [Gammaproteobacteria bacterium]MCF6261879.1 segregation/condensation protein A [Gammaproteobacteria bacterium]
MTDIHEQSPPSQDQPGKQAAQAEMPFAVVQGEAMTALPKDLYIPPEALEVILEAFEGPLDLLLYLIRRQNLDVLNIPIAEITRQYMEYVEMMKSLNLELAADYLVMAAMLAEIKSRMLLPRPVEEDNEEDPRAELVRRLQEYERFKQAAEDIDGLPRMNREVFQASAKTPDLKLIKPEPEVDMRELLSAFKDVLVRVELNTNHQVSMEALSVRERMSDVLDQLDSEKFTEFFTLFSPEEGRPGLVVTFLAILELIKESLIELIQTEPYEPIHIKPRASS